MNKTLDGFVIKDGEQYYGLCAKTLLPIKTKVYANRDNFWASKLVIRSKKDWQDKIYKRKKAAAKLSKVLLAQRLIDLESDLKNTKRKLSLVKGLV